MRILPGAWAGLALTLCATAVSGVDLPRIGVSFHLEASVYRKHFETNGTLDQTSLEQFEKSVAQAILMKLDDAIPFVDFGPGENAWTVHIDLRCEPEIPDKGMPFIETFFVLRLDGVPAEIEWEYLSSSEFATTPGDPANLSEAIPRRFAAGFRRKQPRIVRRVLSNVPLTDKIFVDPPRDRCVLPFTYAELGVGVNTIFIAETRTAPDNKVTHWLFGDFGPQPNLPGPYANGIVAREREPPAGFEHIVHTRLTTVHPHEDWGEIKIEGIRVFDFSLHSPHDEPEDDHEELELPEDAP